MVAMLSAGDHRGRSGWIGRSMLRAPCRCISCNMFKQCPAGIKQPGKRSPATDRSLPKKRCMAAMAIEDFRIYAVHRMLPESGKRLPMKAE